MKNSILSLIIFGLMGQFALGQEPELAKAEWFTTQRWGNDVGTLEVSPHFVGENGQFWYVWKTVTGTDYYWVDPRKGKKVPLLDADLVAGALQEATGKPVSPEKLNLTQILPEENGRVVTFAFDSRTFRYDAVKKTCVPVEKNRPVASASPRRPSLFGKYSPDSAYVAYARRHNLYIRRVSDSVEFCLTTDGERYFSYGMQNDSQDTNNVATRAVWFGDSKKLYVIREDYRKVGEMPWVRIFGNRPTVVTERQALAGDEHVPLFEASVFDVASRRQVKVKMEKWKDQLLWLSHAGKSSDELFIQRKKRTRDELEVCAVDTETGEVRVVIHEVNKPYLNDELYSASYLPDTREILWWSERTGYGHYYLYGYDGRLKRRVTEGQWTAAKIVRLDTAGRTVYFEGYGQIEDGNPYYARLNRVSLDGKGGAKVLTPEEGNHKIRFSPDGKYFVDNWSRPDRVPGSVVRDAQGRLIFQLEHADLTAVQEKGWRMPECFTVKAADSVTNLYGVMWKPVDFDSTRHYPVIAYVYPGPYTEYVPVDFSLTSPSGGMELAQNGFIVVCFGNRGGSPLRGRDYHTFGYGNLRDYPLADNKYGLEQLIGRYSFIDGSKVGIYGHSGGGAMAVAAICTYPDFYTAAVASAGNHDNTIFDYGWSEIHHGIREVVENGDTTFRFLIPTNQELISRLKGHLMLVMGDMDNTVHPANTLRIASVLVNAGKDFELVVLPGQRHGYMGPARKFYQQKIWRHFVRYLR